MTSGILCPFTATCLGSFWRFKYWDKIYFFEQEDFFFPKQADFFLRAIVLLMFLQFVGRILIVKKNTIHRIVLIWGSTLLRLCTLFNMTKESCILVFWYAAITYRSAQRQEKLFSPRKSFQKPQNTCTLKQSLLTGLHAWELLLHYWKLVVRAVELFRNWCAPKCKEWMIHISFYKNAIWFIFFLLQSQSSLKTSLLWDEKV